MPHNLVHAVPKMIPVANQVWEALTGHATREHAPSQGASKCQNESIWLLYLKDKWEITSA